VTPRVALADQRMQCRGNGMPGVEFVKFAATQPNVTDPTMPGAC
jgi:hypothetical protein